ncbi:MAG: ATP-binding protein [Myxococcota bacterium]
MTKTPDYSFLKELGGILNSGQSRAIVLTGETNDLFYVPGDDGPGTYRPLIDFMVANWGSTRGKILVVYELNGPIRFINPEDRDKVAAGWIKWRTGMDANDIAIRRMLVNRRERDDLEELSKNFETNLERAIESPGVALEVLRQMCLCSRSEIGGKPCLDDDLIILIEGADMVIPEGEITRLADADRHRVAICSDWISDPTFMDEDDALILIAESSSLVNHRVVRLPQIIEVRVNAPDADVRRHCIAWFTEQKGQGQEVALWSSQDELARLSAGLSIHGLLQLLKGAVHRGTALTPQDVIAKVETHIKRQLGDDVVEFKKPEHDLDDVVGFTHLKEFLRRELIPRFKSSGDDALPGAAVCGPIGGGKTFIFEAIAKELDIVVLVLKNIRSKWFGETDVVFERLHRVINALSKVLIFVDEADTQFGGVGAGTHDTERRLTGKIQAMMSDPKLRGRVIWLLMTARIHLLSPDIRRPGRVGDLIIPVLDPEGEEREDFCRWMVGKVLDTVPSGDAMQKLLAATDGFSAASFASMRSELSAKAGGNWLTMEDVLDVVGDHIPPAIGNVRLYQTLQALLNCTRRSLLPDPKVSDDTRRGWARQIRVLESQGVH